MNSINPALYILNPYTRAFVVLVGFAFLGWLVHFIFKHLLLRVVRKTQTKLDDLIVAALQQPIFYSVVLIGTYIAVLPLSPDIILLAWIKKVLMILGLLIWGVAALKITTVAFDIFEERTIAEGDTWHQDILPFLKNITRLVILVVLILVTLALWGIDITPALVSGGVAGIAIAFAAKDTVANLFGGISVFLDRPYKTGDYVIINEGYRGEVIQIGMRSTKIKTRDNVLLTVPNAVMITNAVINETGFDSKLRIRIPISLAYSTNLTKAEKVLMSVAREHPVTLTRPAPKVRVRKFGESAIEIELLVVVPSPSDRGRVTHDLLKKIHSTFEQEDLHIPFPQRDIHLKNSPANLE